MVVMKLNELFTLISEEMGYDRNTFDYIDWDAIERAEMEEKEEKEKERLSYGIDITKSNHKQCI